MRRNIGNKDKKKAKHIKGIIQGNEYKLSQYADDTTILLDGREETLTHTLDLLEEFSLHSGLKINFDKTNVIWIGSLKYSTYSVKTRYKLKEQNNLKS